MATKRSINPPRRPAKPAPGDEGLQTGSLAIILEPESVKLDTSGRVTLQDPRVLQAILAAAPSDLRAAGDNTALCNPNFYQCGKVTERAQTDLRANRTDLT